MLASTTTVPHTTSANTAPLTKKLTHDNTYDSMGIKSVDLNVNNQSCINGLPEYEQLRKQNIDTINSYYTDLLSKYTGSYTDYAKNNSGNINDRAFAETQLKPQTVNLNNQMLALNKKMLDSINSDNDNILALKNSLDAKNKAIQENGKTIERLRRTVDNTNIAYKSKNDNLEMTKSGLEDISFWNWIVVGADILLGVLILAMIIYIMMGYADLTSSRNNIINITHNVKKNSGNVSGSGSSNTGKVNAGVSSTKIMV